MKLKKTAVLLLVLTATVACTDSSEQQHWTFSAPELGGGDCDGPCPTIVLDACLLAERGEAFALVQMPDAEPQAVANSCTAEPSYSSSIKRSRALVVEALGGDVRESDELDVVFVSRRFSWLDWEAGDFLLLSLRTDDGEWFVTSAYHATPSSDAVAADQASNRQLSDGLDFQLPNDIAKLRAALSSVEEDYEGRCGQAEMSDTEFRTSVRVDSNCDFVGADESEEEKDSGPSDIDL